MKKLIVAALLGGLALPAFAAPAQGDFSFSLIGGVDTALNGDVHKGAVALIPDLGPLNPDLAGVDAELRIRSRSHSEIYDMATVAGLEMSYGLSDRAEMFGQVRQTRADQGTIQVGGAFVPALNTELPVYGTFSDYKALSVELGYRYYFLQAGSTRPYLAARVGGTQTDAITATFEIPDGGITIANAPFYDKKWAVSGGLDVGVIIPLSERFSLTAETGVRYVDNLSGNDSAIGGLGLASINNTGSRLSMPITVSARWDF